MFGMGLLVATVDSGLGTSWDVLKKLSKKKFVKSFQEHIIISSQFITCFFFFCQWVEVVYKWKTKMWKKQFLIQRRAIYSFTAMLGTANAGGASVATVNCLVDNELKEIKIGSIYKNYFKFPRA